MGHQITIGKKYSSPFHEDRNPSFGFYVNRRGTLCFKDFASDLGGDCFQFVMENYGCSFYQALQHINKDFNLNLGTGQAVIAKVREPIKYAPTTKKLSIKIRAKKYSEKELNWWKQYGITLEILKRYSVYSVSHLWIKNSLVSVSKPYDPVYAYYFKNSKSLKIYRPLNKRYKWTSNTTSTDIQGWEQLDQDAEKIIITSSMKDVMTLASLGYSAIAPQSEGASLENSGLKNWIEESNAKFYLLFDNDEAGLKAAERWKASYKEFNVLELPTLTHLPQQPKDPSDFVSVLGQQPLKTFLNKWVD
jgi:DNA primase